MRASAAGDELLELGLLLVVTGLFVGVMITGLVLVYARESTVASSQPLAVVTSAALSGIAVIVLTLFRRVIRTMASR